MELRRATFDDRYLLLNWREQDERADWWRGRDVTPQGHNQWLLDRLDNPAVDLWVIEDNQRQVGQVRSDSNGEISISIDEHQRRKGYAREALTEATRRTLAKHGRVKACVDATNRPAVELFEACGYKRHDVFFFRHGPES